MATNSDVAPVNSVWVRELHSWIDSRLCANWRAAVWPVLTPLPKEAPADDVNWLRGVKAALTTIPLPPALAETLVGRLRTTLSQHRWTELVDAVADAWLDHPEPLLDGLVLGRLDSLAEQATWRQSPPIRQATRDDAPGVILEAFSKFDRTQPFNPWARRVLHNHAVSLWRRQYRRR